MLHRGDGHDIIVIGASAGGVEAMRTVLRGLPADLPAAVFLVVHVGEVSTLAEILVGAGPLPVTQAVSGEEVARGRVYVAGPGAHLLLHDGHVLLRRGPRENLSRPAVDPLFRSAAIGFGGRVVGVVLTGTLSDGTAGLRAVKRCGGLAVVQSPADAAFPDMPQSALRHVEVDHVVPACGLGSLLARLAREPAGTTPDIPVDIRMETTIATWELSDRFADDAPGSPSGFTCPECNGSLREIGDGDMLRYRCHLGHAFTADAVLAGRDGEIDGMLERLLRSHRERAALARRLLDRESRPERSGPPKHLETRVTDYERDAERVRLLAAGRNGARLDGFDGDPERADGSRAAVAMAATPLFDEDGRAAGGIAEMLDTSERKRAEAHQQMLLNELQHRVKNIVSTVGALASRMLRASRSPEDFAEAFQGRLQSMARVHELLSASEWSGVGLRQLVETILRPVWSGRTGRVRLDGPEVLLSANAASTLGMVLYELSTNAAKYGALSIDAGSVQVTWRADGQDGTIRLDWVEQDGPEPSAELKPGFGASFMKRMVEYEMLGSCELDLRPSGMWCRIAFPRASNLQRAEAQQSAPTVGNNCGPAQV